MADEDAKANEKQEADDAAKGVYSPSTAQLDAERRAAELNPEGEVDPAGQVVGHRVSEQPKYGAEEGYGYLGTDPIYQNSADDRQRPFTDEDDWQRKLMVPPTDDAGEKTLPYVPGTRPAGPSVEVGEAKKSDSQEGDGEKDGEDDVEQKPAAKATKSVPSAPKKSTAPAK